MRHRARAELVSKLLGRMHTLEPTQLPALVYQLLLLADTDGKPEVLRALHEHFEAQVRTARTARTARTV